MNDNNNLNIDHMKFFQVSNNPTHNSFIDTPTYPPIFIVSQIIDNCSRNFNYLRVGTNTALWSTSNRRSAINKGETMEQVVIENDEGYSVEGNVIEYHKGLRVTIVDGDGNKHEGYIVEFL